MRDLARILLAVLFLLVVGWVFSYFEWIPWQVRTVILLAVFLLSAPLVMLSDSAFGVIAIWLYRNIREGKSIPREELRVAGILFFLSSVCFISIWAVALLFVNVQPSTYLTAVMLVVAPMLALAYWRKMKNSLKLPIWIHPIIFGFIGGVLYILFSDFIGAWIVFTAMCMEGMVVFDEVSEWAKERGVHPKQRR